MSCLHCSEGLWQSPDARQHDGFMWCYKMNGWMNENASCSFDSSGKQEREQG